MIQRPNHFPTPNPNPNPNPYLRQTKQVLISGYSLCFPWAGEPHTKSVELLRESFKDYKSILAVDVGDEDPIKSRLEAIDAATAVLTNQCLTAAPASKPALKSRLALLNGEKVQLMEFAGGIGEKKMPDTVTEKPKADPGKPPKQASAKQYQ